MAVDKGGRPKSKMMEPKPPVEFTPARKQKFLEHFEKTGMRALSAQYAGVSISAISDHKRNDKAFAEAYEEAINRHTEHRYIREAERRGLEGVSEPIIGGQFKDQIVATVQRYSDPLLLALLRARRPEFNKGAGAEDGTEGNGSGGGVLIVAQAPHTIGEWETLFGDKARASVGRELTA